MRVCYLDLDDTLIPTTWLRRQFASLRSHDRIADDKAIYLQVKGQLDEFAQAYMAEIAHERSAEEPASPSKCTDTTASVETVASTPPIAAATRRKLRFSTRLKVIPFKLTNRAHAVPAAALAVVYDNLVLKLLDLICASYDKVVVVTNARSHTWIDTFKYMFPVLHRGMQAKSIPIIKTQPPSIEPCWIRSPQAYFNFWCTAKYDAFQQVLDSLPATQKSVLGDMLCIGDNNFEHYAFIRLTNTVKPDNSMIIKCVCGLEPIGFFQQLGQIMKLIDTSDIPEDIVTSQAPAHRVHSIRWSATKQSPLSHFIKSVLTL